MNFFRLSIFLFIFGISMNFLQLESKTQVLDLAFGRFLILEFDQNIISDIYLTDTKLVKFYKLAKSLSSFNEKNILIVHALNYSGELDVLFDLESESERFKIKLNKKLNSENQLLENSSVIKFRKLKLNPGALLKIQTDSYFRENILGSRADSMVLKALHGLVSDKFMQVILLEMADAEFEADLIIPTERAIYYIPVEVKKGGSTYEKYKEINLD